MSMYKPGGTSKAAAKPTVGSEFEILKASHKFLHEDEQEHELSWNEQLAKKYYSNLYREYAVCDLKHYKSGNFALRWRTEAEVIAGAGETTCGNTRCPLHDQRAVDEAHASLKTLELPFSYVEAGGNKFALVKVVLCNKCLKKLMWKRTKEKEKAQVGRAVQGEDISKQEVRSAEGLPEARSPRKRGRDGDDHRKREDSSTVPRQDKERKRRRNSDDTKSPSSSHTRHVPSSHQR